MLIPVIMSYVYHDSDRVLITVLTKNSKTVSSSLQIIIRMNLKNVSIKMQYL